MLLGTLGASVLENMLNEKGVIKGVMRARRGYNNMDHMNKDFYFRVCHKSQ